MGEIAGGMLVGMRIRVQRILKENNAFNEDKAVDLEKAGIKEKGVLKFMEEHDLLKVTNDGKVYVTEKGRRVRQGI